MDFEGWHFRWVKTDCGTVLTLVGLGNQDYTYFTVDQGFLGNGLSVSTVLLFGAFLIVLVLLVHA